MPCHFASFFAAASSSSGWDALRIDGAGSAGTIDLGSWRQVRGVETPALIAEDFDAVQAAPGAQPGLAPTPEKD
jgi:hypothetical protein